MSSPEPAHPEATPSGLVPVRADDARSADALLRAHGACILRWPERGKDGVVGAGRAVLGDRLLANAEIWTLRPHPAPGMPTRVQRPGWVTWEATENGDADDPVRVGPDPLSAEMWGGYPDVVAVSCDEAPAEGGRYYAVDGYGLLASLASPGGPGGLLDQLWTVPVPHRRHTRFDYPPWEATPFARRTSSGKVSVLYAPHALTLSEPGGAQPDDTRTMVGAWHSLVDSAARAAPRFALDAGDVLFVDNFRVFVGRDGYGGPRVMQRVSFWTRDAHEYPVHGERAARDGVAPAETPPAGEPFGVTERAARRLGPLLTTEAGRPTAVRVTVQTRGCAGLWYRLTLREQAIASDVVLESRGISVLVDRDDVQYLRGSTIDWTDRGFTVRNAKIKAACACGASFAYRDEHVAELARRQPERGLNIPHS